VTTCPSVGDLYLHLEGELGPREARALAAHLERCPACRERLAERRLLHEAFTSLPPFEVPPDFALSVMDRLPEPTETKAGWIGPLVAATVSLMIGLFGFSLLTGQSLSEFLVAVNRFFGSVVAQLLPLAAKMFKIGNVLLKVGADLASMALAAIGTFARALGPQGIALILGLGLVLSLLAIFGARRLLSLGERT
jgi:predicted anti-sigma-YlaC factor YlaD